MERDKENETPEFSIDNRGFNVKAWYLKDTETEKGDALIVITKGEEVIRQFTFPAYKIYNIAAHFADIVDSEIEQDTAGYEIASSDGLGGHAPIKPIQ